MNRAAIHDNPALTNLVLTYGDIPENLIGTLLPPLDLSVSEFLKFDFPLLPTKNSSIRLSWSPCSLE
jgi:hypothetical protein